MEASQSGKRRSPTQTKRALIVEVWNRLGGAAIGEAELGEIQRSIRSRFGPAADESPAAIARVLADEGAELRHPEVIEFDARWREAKIENENGQFKGLEDLLTGIPLRLKHAQTLLEKLESLRQRAENSGDQSALEQTRDIAIVARQTAELSAKDRKLNKPQQAEQNEIAEWLKVWIQTPGLFADWLDLRRRSTEFQKKFSATEKAP
jgi:hypothetical protein